MKILINDIPVKFVLKKDKTLYRNKWKTIKETPDGSFVYVEGTKGVVVIPYRYGKNGVEILVRAEANPLHENFITLITGRKDDHENGIDWYNKTAERELAEEGGLFPTNGFVNQGSPIYLGEMICGKDVKSKDTIVAVNCTEFRQTTPKTDGTKWEKESSNFWIDIPALKQYIIANDEIDSTMYSALLRFSSHFRIFKSEEIEELSKAVKSKPKQSSSGPSKLKGREKPGHKYIRRVPLPGGGYRYIYEEPKGRTKKPEETKQGKGTVLEQLISAITKRGQEKKEATPKKVNPFEENRRVPADIPDVAKKMTMETLLGNIDGIVSLRMLEVQKDFRSNLISKYVNDPEIHENHSTHVIKVLDGTGSRDVLAGLKIAGLLPEHDDIILDNKKLKPETKVAVKNAIIDLIGAIGVLQTTSSMLNSSYVENMYNQISMKLDHADTKEKENVYHEVFDNLIDFNGSIFNVIERTITQYEKMSWLKGEDSKFDYLSEVLFNEYAEVVKARDNYLINTTKLFIDRVESKINNMNNYHNIAAVFAMINKLETFTTDNIFSFKKSKEHSFYNLWNQKPKGLYDNITKYSSISLEKFITKYKSIDDLNERAASSLAARMGASKVFDFLTLNYNPKSVEQESVRTSEKVFSYVETHGIDKYIQDVFYMRGIQDKYFDLRDAKVEDVKDVKLHILDAINKGIDVYSDDDIRYYFDEMFHKRFGDIQTRDRAGNFSSIMNTLILSHPTSSIDSKISAFISMWSGGSHSSVMLNSLEQFVNTKAIDRKSFVNYHLAANRSIISRRIDVKEGLSKAIESVYNRSRTDLDELYPEGKVKLFRGNGSTEVKSTASSWTDDEEVSYNFGDHIEEKEIPTSAILTSYFTDADSWKYINEKEFVVIPGLIKNE